MAEIACLRPDRSSTRAITPPDGGSQKSVNQEERIMQTINLSDARTIIAAAEKKADEIGQPMNIAIVDTGGNLVAHVRQDGAWIGSVEISINKAWTARAFDIQTKDLGDNSQPGQQFFGIHTVNGGKVMIFAGGVPLTRGDAVIGGLGVSGGSGEQDQAVALAGLDALAGD
ncbi:heme-binding protein [Streptomyces shenzhenensis]|uniref:GlcG/HbpS family heme-binding protein n=1 Tax=Streptomyces shenzhenensis TaxID=943815 RepID=UPI0036C16447